jgi:hypothetical protein
MRQSVKCLIIPTFKQQTPQAEKNDTNQPHLLYTRTLNEPSFYNLSNWLLVLSSLMVQKKPTKKN